MTDFSKLNRDVVFGKAGRKIIWQPRIGCWYSDRIFSGNGLPRPYTGMSLPELFRALRCSMRLYEFNPCFVRVEDKSVRISKRRLNDTDIETTFETPVGKQVAINRHPPDVEDSLPLKWEVESEEELKVATWREEHTHWRWDQSYYDQLLREVGDLGAPTIWMPRMNVQSLYLNKMGVEKGVYALYDWPETTEKYFQALQESHDRLMEIICASPIEIINFGENVHSGTLSPDLFVRWHLPECRRRCEKLHAAGKFVHSHWDGDCAPLLKYAKDTGLDGIEAITPKPQGDVEIEQIKEALGDDLFLLDGIPAILFESTYSEKTLIDCAEKLIALFAPKLVLGISDEISSRGDIERIRLIGEIVARYNSNQG